MRHLTRNISIVLLILLSVLVPSCQSNAEEIVIDTPVQIEVPETPVAVEEQEPPVAEEPEEVLDGEACIIHGIVKHESHVVLCRLEVYLIVCADHPSLSPSS